MARPSPKHFFQLQGSQREPGSPRKKDIVAGQTPNTGGDCGIQLRRRQRAASYPRWTGCGFLHHWPRLFRKRIRSRRLLSIAGMAMNATSNLNPTTTPNALENFAARPKAQRKGVGLALSGGGYRAALFHLGGLRRLNELGI